MKRCLSVLMAVTLTTMFVVLSACSTTNTSVKVKRAPQISLDGIEKLAISVKEVKGQQVWRRKKNCGETGFFLNGAVDKVEGEIPGSIEQYYRTNIEKSLQRVLRHSLPQLTIVPVAQADAVVELSLFAKEIRSVSSENGVNNTCRLENSARVEIGVAASLTKSGASSKQGDFQLAADSSTSSCHLTGDPNYVTSCQETVHYAGFAPKEVNVEIPFEKMLNESRVKVLRGTQRHFARLFFPYVVTLDMAIYKLKAPKNADRAADLMKQGRWYEAFRVLSALKAEAEGLEGDEKAYFFYDYAFVLLQLERYQEAMDALDKAKALRGKKDYQKLRGEIMQRTQDAKKLN